MPPTTEPFATGLVLAAGGSSRLGRPKQLLPYRGGTLLDWTLGTARRCGFDQLIIVLGGGLDEVRRQVDLGGVDVVVNERYGEGCASSIAAALDALDPRCEVLVLLLGDQPGVRPETVRALLAGRGDAPLAVCRYEDGRGHPLAFGREAFADLEAHRRSELGQGARDRRVADHRDARRGDVGLQEDLERAAAQARVGDDDGALLVGRPVDLARDDPDQHRLARLQRAQRVQAHRLVRARPADEALDRPVWPHHGPVAGAGDRRARAAHDDRLDVRRRGHPCSAAHTFAGLSGMSTWRTPMASITALTTAGGEPTVADSPTPFAPRG